MQNLLNIKLKITTNYAVRPEDSVNVMYTIQSEKSFKRVSSSYPIDLMKAMYFCECMKGGHKGEMLENSLLNITKFLNRVHL